MSLASFSPTRLVWRMARDKEIEAVVRGQAERMLRDLDVVQREAVKAMMQKARDF